MATLGNPTNTIAILQKYNFNFQKKFGQNFLIDSNILENIIEAANVTKQDCVLEIGPGIGTMTQYLCENAREVVAVEIDKKLIPILENDTLAPYDNISIINEDILKVDINKIVQEKNDGKPVKVVANLPYYITTPIITGVIDAKLPLKNLVVMVQKEVADRLSAKPGSKDYGAISVLCQYYTNVEIVTVVPADLFVPPPKVDSAVVKMVFRDTPAVSPKDEGMFFKTVKAAFSQRRKTLLNCLTANFSKSKEELTAIMESVGIDPRRRGETLSLEEFKTLSDMLS